MKSAISTRVVAVILAAMLFGCGGGGGSKSPPSDPGAELLPASYDFGTVTPNSTPAPLVVKINSVGTTRLSVSNIVLSDETNFSIDLDGGSDPCGSRTPRLDAGGTCTFEVQFHPTTAAVFTANVRIANNDQTRTVQLSGTSEDVTELTVRINQAIADCSDDTWTAYVSVTDQAGYPYAGLTIEDFIVEVSGTTHDIEEISRPSALPSPISVVAVLDYSSSITDHPEIVSDMEEGLIDFINRMGTDDEAAIIKFDNEVAVVQQLTSDKNLLITAIRADFDQGPDTRLFDAVSEAIQVSAGAANVRRAVLVLTDGNDSGGPTTIDDVIFQANAGGIPVFPIALGTNWSRNVLERMADDTGGQLFEASTSDNIRNAYWQLASLLFQNQYVLSFVGLPAAGDLTVAVDALDGSFTDDRNINLCPE